MLCFYRTEIAPAEVMIVWYLDLQLPLQSGHIPTKGVRRLNHAHGGMYSIELYVIKFVSDL
jgi:hypothetical protein